LATKIRKVHNHNGFTLVELMIVTAIIGLLAAIAVPNFIAYRYRAKIASSVQTSDSIRAAFAGFAASEPDNLFPDVSSISSWLDLSVVCNINGATLKDNETAQGLIFNSYDDLGTRSDYYLILNVQGVPADVTGSQIEIRASGIIKQTLG
jgi:prepilin-type N-terminal cleavage/methylation domain-containing protein